MTDNDVEQDPHQQRKVEYLKEFHYGLCVHAECTEDLWEALHSLEGESLTRFIHAMKAALKLPRFWIATVHGWPEVGDSFNYELDGFVDGRSSFGWELRRDEIYKRHPLLPREEIVVTIDAPREVTFKDGRYPYSSVRALTQKADAEKWATEERDRLNALYRTTATCRESRS